MTTGLFLTGENRHARRLWLDGRPAVTLAGLKSKTFTAGFVSNDWNSATRSVLSPVGCSYICGGRASI